jgi:hypothetical protein
MCYWKCYISHNTREISGLARIRQHAQETDDSDTLSWFIRTLCASRRPAGGMRDQGEEALDRRTGVHSTGFHRRQKDYFDPIRLRPDNTGT